MTSIRSQDTKPELLLRQSLWQSGLRYRKSYKVEGVRVDIAFPGRKLAVFVDGCFWHGCPDHYREPPRNKAYWQPKIERNQARDRRNTEALEKAGWTVLRFWEHEILEDLRRTTERTRAALP
jgi:DNA mismatch endonuclease (patch repair protein)